MYNREILLYILKSLCQTNAMCEPWLLALTRCLFVSNNFFMRACTMYTSICIYVCRYMYVGMYAFVFYSYVNTITTSLSYLYIRTIYFLHLYHPNTLIKAEMFEEMNSLIIKKSKIGDIIKTNFQVNVTLTHKWN